jgi:hypothetical protein
MNCDPTFGWCNRCKLGFAFNDAYKCVAASCKQGTKNQYCAACNANDGTCTKCEKPGSTPLLVMPISAIYANVPMPQSQVRSWAGRAGRAERHGRSSSRSMGAAAAAGGLQQLPRGCMCSSSSKQSQHSPPPILTIPHCPPSIARLPARPQCVSASRLAAEFTAVNGGGSMPALPQGCAEVTPDFKCARCIDGQSLTNGKCTA